jgi:flagellar motor switch protein FliN/FliY
VNNEDKIKNPPFDIADGERVWKTISPEMPELLMDIELEATLRFGSREMTIGEVLDLGPGDVIELDRQADDVVDLLIGDKIIARGIAVLCNGRYGLRVTEVAELKMSLESVHCLF